MSYGTPTRVGKAQYTGRSTARLTSAAGMDADLVVSFALTLEQAAEIYLDDPEAVLVPNFQELLDYIAAFPGFTLPAGLTDYTAVAAPVTSGSKVTTQAAEVTPAP